MLVKEGQSLLDFINFLPLQAIKVHRAPLSNREAQTLYAIWEGDRDKDGNVVLSSDIDAMQIAALKTKGMIRSKPSMASVFHGNAPLVEITKQGQDVIRNIILYTEKNAFEKSAKSAKDIDYESIFIATMDNPSVNTRSHKSASKDLSIFKVISKEIE